MLRATASSPTTVTLIGSALATIVVWMIGVAGYVVPPEVAIAFGTVFGGFIGVCSKILEVEFREIPKLNRDFFDADGLPDDKPDQSG